MASSEKFAFQSQVRRFFGPGLFKTETKGGGKSFLLMMPRRPRNSPSLQRLKLEKPSKGKKIPLLEKYLSSISFSLRIVNCRGCSFTQMEWNGILMFQFGAKVKDIVREQYYKLYWNTPNRNSEVLKAVILTIAGLETFPSQKVGLDAANTQKYQGLNLGKACEYFKACLGLKVTASARLNKKVNWFESPMDLNIIFPLTKASLMPITLLGPRLKTRSTFHFNCHRI